MTSWEESERLNRETRRARRGWPPPDRRPRCLHCERVLQPTWKRESNPSHLSLETDVIDGFGALDAFCTNLCAIRFALNTPAGRARLARVKAIIEILNTERRNSKPEGAF